jgi:hypothetical protein
MGETTRADYLSRFTDRAVAAGLPMKKPGNNWAPMRDVAPGSHVSLSVTRSKLQVNLNNEHDVDRSVFNRLHEERQTIENEIGISLIWEHKKDIKKTAIRAELKASYDDLDKWDQQHQWAIEMMQRFQRVFGDHL